MSGEHIRGDAAGCSYRWSSYRRCFTCSCARRLCSSREGARGGAGLELVSDGELRGVIYFAVWIVSCQKLISR